MKENYVVDYKYINLKEHEKNYVIHDLELASIIHSLEIWWHYLIGRIFLLMSNNISLKYLFDQQNLNTWQAIWLAFISEYDLEINHIKGKENKVVNALSRHANLVYMTTSSSYETDLEEKIKTIMDKDEKF